MRINDNNTTTTTITMYASAGPRVAPQCDNDRIGNGGNRGLGNFGCNNDVRVGRCSSSFEDVTSVLKSNTTTTTMNNDDDDGNEQAEGV